MSRPLLSVEHMQRSTTACAACPREISRGDLRVRYCRGSWTKFIHAECVIRSDMIIYCPDDPFAVVFDTSVSPAERRQFMADLATLPSQGMRRMRRLLSPLELPRLRGDVERGSSRYLEARAQLSLTPQPPRDTRQERQENQQGGVSDKLVNLLPTYLGSTSRRGHENTCTICLNDFKTTEEVMRLPCFHEFHSQCIRNWLQKSRLCPIDKTDVVKATRH